MQVFAVNEKDVIFLKDVIFNTSAEILQRTILFERSVLYPELIKSFISASK